jgi:protein-S-isoprenylcysteine O-methyltransferase Ste14
VRVRAAIGVVLCLAGLVWIFQGTNVLHGSGMSGHGEWTVIGSVLFVLGAALLVWAWRLRAKRIL